MVTMLDEPKQVDTPKRTVLYRQSRRPHRRPRKRPPPAQPAPPATRGEDEPSATTLRRWRLIVAALIVLLAGLLAATGYLGQRWYADRALDSARQQALAAARQLTLNFVSVSASTVDRDLARIVAGATGEFKDEFTRGMAQVRAAVVENNVDSHGSVLRAGVVSVDRDSAVVLVAVDATVKNVRAPQGRLSHYRIQVDVARDAKAGAWLVARLQFVG
jgi:Mce-associated membrane protein